MIICLFHRKQLLIREDDLPLLFLICCSLLKLAASLKPATLVLTCEQLNFLELVGVELKFIFGSVLIRGSPRISVNTLLNDLEVSGRVDNAFFSRSWTVSFVFKFIEPFDNISTNTENRIEKFRIDDFLEKTNLK